MKMEVFISCLSISYFDNEKPKETANICQINNYYIIY